MASPDGRDGSLHTHRYGALYAALLAAEEQLEQSLALGRVGYLHLARGAWEVNGLSLTSGDAVTVRSEPRVWLRARAPSELLWFDLPA